MQTKPLHNDFGLEVIGCDLARLEVAGRFAEIRALFEQHSLLLFRDQSFHRIKHSSRCVIYTATR